MWVVTLITVAKLASAIREILLAQVYGMTPLMDAYQFVSNLASWPASIFSAICSAMLIPAYSRARALGVSQMMHVRSQAHSATLVLCVLFSLIWIGLCLTTPLLGNWSGLPDYTASYSVHFVLPMAVTIFCGLYAALLSAECISIRIHGNLLLDAIPSLVLAGFLLAWEDGGEMLLISSTIVGPIVALALMTAYLSRHLSLPSLSLRIDRPQWRLLFSSVSTLLAAQCLQATTNLVDQFWAAQLSAGALSVLGYSNRILFVILAIGATGITRTVLPRLADWQIANPVRGFRSALVWSLWVFGFASLVMVLLWPFTPLLVSWIYERGAFGAAETLRVSSFLQISWVQLPLTFGGLILIQQLLAVRGYFIMLLIALMNLVVKVIGNWILTPICGIEGLAISGAIMQLSTFCLLMLWWLWKSKKV